MNEEEFMNVREKLEKIAEGDIKKIETETNIIKKEDIINHHKNYMTAMNMTYQLFCIEFNIRYEPIKTKFTN